MTESILLNQQVGSLLNFSLMYLLAPTAGGAAAASSGFVARAISGETLRALGAPGTLPSGNHLHPMRPEIPDIHCSFLLKHTHHHIPTRVENKQTLDLML